MDRDDNGIPDYMEDERYADERYERPRHPGGFAGCGTVLPLLLGAAALAAAAYRRSQR
ncbi:MAG TPA: hypothetical protein VG276_27380 [Actinomycetes bacterium]|nr:hypothetical protein [Actinomycetes bacterium]